MSVGAQRLDWGNLDLINADGGYETFSLHALGEGADFGEPQPVEVTVATLMGDGVRTDTSHYENREITFRVTVEAADAGGLADGEAALDALVGTRTTLTWQAPDGYGPPTVFDVETSRKRFLFSDLDEVRRVKQRTFQVTLNCLPFGRSDTPVTIGAEFIADTVTIADDCESTSGWSATGELSTWNPVAIAVDSTAGYHVTGTGSLRLTPAGTVTAISSSLSHRMHVAKSGLSIDASSGGYLTVRLRTEWQFVSQDNIVDAHVTTSGGGRQAVSTLVSAADGNGFVRLSWAAPDASTITGFDLNVWQQSIGVSGLASPKSWFDSIGLAANSSSAQAVTRFDVLGSMRTEASFEVSSAAGLGDVLLYTCPDRGDGFAPNLMKYRTSGSTTVDAAAINGVHTSPAGVGFETVISAPQSIFRQGAYAVLARLKESSGPTVTVTAQTKIGTTLVGPVYTVTGEVDLPDANYHVARIGVLDLPPLVTDPASNAVTVFTVTAAGGTVNLDELLVFPLEDAALTWVECGSGSPSATVASRLWIDAPSSTQPRGARLVGNSSARLDARYVRPESRGKHLLLPGPNLTYLMTSAAGGADMQIVYYPKAHTNNAYAGS